MSCRVVLDLRVVPNFATHTCDLVHIYDPEILNSVKIKEIGVT